MGTCETVKIKGKDGQPVIINKEDFDSKIHALHGTSEPVEEKTKGRPRKDR